MAGTFSQIYIQLVFAVKDRENLIGNSRESELRKYIAGIINGNGNLRGFDFCGLFFLAGGDMVHFHIPIRTLKKRSVSDLGF